MKSRNSDKVECKGRTEAPGIYSGYRRNSDKVECKFAYIVGNYASHDVEIATKWTELNVLKENLSD